MTLKSILDLDSRLLKMASFDRSHTSSYSSSIGPLLTAQYEPKQYSAMQFEPFSENTLSTFARYRHSTWMRGLLCPADVVKLCISSYFWCACESDLAQNMRTWPQNNCRSTLQTQGTETAPVAAVIVPISWSIGLHNTMHVVSEIMKPYDFHTLVL